MKTIAAGLISLLFFTGIYAQRTCVTAEYEKQVLQADPALHQKIQQAYNNLDIPSTTQQVSTLPAIIRIPVVVHILYNNASENISQEQVLSQLAALNRDFNKLNTDVNLIPARFAPFAASVQIQFELAKVDPKGRATTGITRKYTPVKSWQMDDKIKFNVSGGNDAWDAGKYLNVWVGNLGQILGYASVVGGAMEKDGIVIATRAFGTINTAEPFHLGRTMVHEAGHWLGLKHIWGDADCGDDLVHDTPVQRSFTTGCPSGTRVSCGSADGDMYMNYMDFTNDACMFMFTHGQKDRMRQLFAPGSFRHALLSSPALGEPTNDEIPVENETQPKWTQVKLFPNPATNSITLNMEYDSRWVGTSLQVINITGKVMQKWIVKSKIEAIDISKLKPGIYFISGMQGTASINQKFIKL